MIDAFIGPMLWHAMFMPPPYQASFPFALAGKPADMQTTGEEAAALLVDLSYRLLRYSSMSVPVRIMSGDRGLVVNPAHALLPSRLLPNSEYSCLRGLGHMVHHFAQSAVLAAVQALATGDDHA